VAREDPSDMARRPCPACTREDATQDLTHVSPKLEVKYFRCAACGHVWVTYRDGEIAHHVSPLTRGT